MINRWTEAINTETLVALLDDSDFYFASIFNTIYINMHIQYSRKRLLICGQNDAEMAD